MALVFKCYLDDAEVEEPINMSDLEISILRDDDLHGISSSATTSPLRFIGDGAAYIEEVKKSQGLKANIVFKATTNCGDDSDAFDTILEGKLNMEQYHKSCGIECEVAIPVESLSCETILKNRYDQNVDLDKITSSNNNYVLPGYAAMGLDMTLPTRELDYKTEGYVKDEGYTFGIAPDTEFVQQWKLRPDYENKKAENIHDSQLDGSESFAFDTPGFPGIISTQVLFNERTIDFPDPIVVNCRMKGNISWPATPISTEIYLYLFRGNIADWTFAFPDGGISIQQHVVVNLTTNPGPRSYDFDFTFDTYNWVPNGSGSDGIYAFMWVNGANDGTLYTVRWDKETFFKAETTKQVPATNTKAYLIHETLSRITENITDLCCRVKSSYYGRQDSEPFAFDNDGCGGLRFLTSGLKIRNAANPTFFTSLKTVIEGLRAIDNIGMAVEPDPDRPGFFLLRVEDLDYFYQDNQLLSHEAIPVGDDSIEAGRNYAKITIGYKTWETQANFGLDEFNSNREYRTALTSVTGALDIMSELVAGEYAIELTREQQFVDTSEADTGYDNSVFIVCLKRSEEPGYPYGQMIVEQGNVLSPENIFSPGSIYNYGISPIRNLMRWYRSIVASYPNITDSENKLYFSSGTGNILAKGELSALYGGTCRLEAFPLQENQDLFLLQFQDQAKATPIWRNELITYDYPMSIADFNKVKAAPYGYISFQCGSNEFEKGWIKEIKFKPFEGMANFTLRRKWS